MIFLENQNNFIQERFLAKIKDKPVEIFLSNGYHTKCKIVRSDNYVIVIRPMVENVVLEATQLIFKSSLASIVCNEVIDVPANIPVTQQNKKNNKQESPKQGNQPKPKELKNQNPKDFNLKEQPIQKKKEDVIEAVNDDFTKKVPEEDASEKDMFGMKVDTEEQKEEQKEENNNMTIKNLLSELTSRNENH